MIEWNNNEVINDYFVWLCEKAGIDQVKESYWKLAKALYHKAFICLVPNDDNRAFEGRDFRDKFCEEIDIEYIESEFPREVSMLEVLIGLAYRCEAIMADQFDGLPMSEWFWKMMRNVELDRFTDSTFHDWYEDGEVDEILDRIIERGYRRDGKGGLFPLKHARKDQRKVELWYQMNTYLVENYYFDEDVM